MDSKDSAAREEILESWVAEQRRRQQAPAETPKLTRRSKLRMRWAQRAQGLANRALDRDLGTLQGDLELKHQHRDRVQYVASDWHVLPRALRYIGVSESDVFVDLGCGKGRVVHQAAKRRFRRVIGVEISPVLADQARQLLAEHRHQYRCPNVEIVVADAAEYRVPDDLTVAYLFFPFHNATFSTVLGHMIESLDRHPRRMRLIYCLPSHTATEQILATKRFRLLKEQRTRLLDTLLSRTQIFESI